MRFPKRNKIARKCDLEKNIRYPQIKHFVPKCYWYSLGSAWYDFWFVQEGMEKVKTQVVCEIRIDESNFIRLGEKKGKGKVLIVDGKEDVIKLTKKYISKSSGYYLLDFTKIGKMYGGIEFRNYKRHREFLNDPKYLWYLMIDASGGCVWDTSLIDVTQKGKLKDFV